MHESQAVVYQLVDFALRWQLWVFEGFVRPNKDRGALRELIEPSQDKGCARSVCLDQSIFRNGSGRIIIAHKDS